MANGPSIESRLWEAADELRANSKLKASEYSVPVLGLIFLRYADVKFTHAQIALATETITNPSSRRRQSGGKLDYQGADHRTRRSCLRGKEQRADR